MGKKYNTFPASRKANPRDTAKKRARRLVTLGGGAFQAYRSSYKRAMKAHHASVRETRRRLRETEGVQSPTIADVYAIMLRRNRGGNTDGL